MQSVSSRIWTRVTVSMSHDDNHYTTGSEGKLHSRFESQSTEELAYMQYDWITVNDSI